MREPSITIGVASPVSDQVAGVGDYVALLKPRVMSLVVFTAFVGLVLAPGRALTRYQRQHRHAGPGVIVAAI